MADVNEFSEDDYADDTLYDDPQPLPDSGNSLEEDEIRTNSDSIVRRISFLVELVIAFVMYTYVMISIFFTIIIPSSFTPLFTHTNMTPNTTSNVSQLLKDIGQNGLLMLLFLLQHSLMSRCNLDCIMNHFNIGPYTRGLYVVCTCIVIQIIRLLWIPMTEQVWQFQTDSTPLFVAMVTVHVLSWFFMALSLFTCDYLELLGIKQIYYHYKGLDSPLAVKSQKQNSLLSNMRHPILLTPSLVLWTVPVMTYDRLLLAVMVPLYLIWGSKLKESDVEYVQLMFQEKKKSLFSNNQKTE